MRLPSGLRRLLLIVAAGLASAGSVAAALLPAAIGGAPTGTACHGTTLAQRLDWRPAGTIRIATYNASLNRATPGELRRNLATREDPQARTIAAVIRRVRPDVLLITSSTTTRQARQRGCSPGTISSRARPARPRPRCACRTGSRRR